MINNITAIVITISALFEWRPLTLELRKLVFASCGKMCAEVSTHDKRLR